jgi:hypothetical protein
MNATAHRQKADRKAQDIISEKHREALGRDGSIDIDRPSTILRRRLLEEQDLIVSGPASLGSDRLDKVEHWADDAYLSSVEASEDAFVQITKGQTLKITLLDALQIGARNSFDYQTQKENVFREALRWIWNVMSSGRSSKDSSQYDLSIPPATVLRAGRCKAGRYRPASDFMMERRSAQDLRLIWRIC